MSEDNERIQHLERTIDDLTDQVKQLQDDLEAAIKAAGKLEDALEHLKTKKWWEL